MKTRPLFIGAALLIVCGCSHRGERGRALLIVNGDTLTMAQVRAVAAGTALPDSLALACAARQLALGALASPVDTVRLAAAAGDLAERLSLTTGMDWKKPSCLSLLAAGRVLQDKTRELHSGERAAAFADSLTKANARVVGATLAGIGRPGGGSSSDGGGADLPALLARLFFLPDAAARLADEFLADTASGAGLSDAQKAVSGLLFDASRTPQHARITVARRANALLALKFRSQQSVKDSIVKHQVDIKELYELTLKAHANTAGKIWVSFVVAPNGTVVSASIKASEISEAGFTAPFLKYVEGIRFKPIPDKVGDMSFIFPFEFARE